MAKNIKENIETRLLDERICYTETRLRKAENTIESLKRELILLRSAVEEDPLMASKIRVREYAKIAKERHVELPDHLKKSEKS